MKENLFEKCIDIVKLKVVSVQFPLELMIILIEFISDLFAGIYQRCHNKDLFIPILVHIFLLGISNFEL